MCATCEAASSLTGTLPLPFAGRPSEAVERFGEDTYHTALEELLERNRRAMRQLIMETIREEKQYFEDYICDDGLGMGPPHRPTHSLGSAPDPD